MINSELYKQLRVRLKENRRLGQGGVGRWGLTRVVVQGLVVQPWLVIGPVAGAVALASWWMGKEDLTKVILRVFGGP